MGSSALRPSKALTVEKWNLVDCPSKFSCSFCFLCLESEQENVSRLTSSPRAHKLELEEMVMTKVYQFVTGLLQEAEPCLHSILSVFLFKVYLQCQTFQIFLKGKIICINGW